MTIEEAILIELFGILLILFAGVNLLTNTYFLGSWDIIGDMTIWMVGGLVIGPYGIFAGLYSER
ncbi:hypothetical protein [Haladaptatus salinisoli]|uniref:hypothetical protein n=1 Tax=Haladaptatus salinisoli TaxID=2884876 RepID=UPI001D0B541F|nr:hypothetical protein [Haladaptatus salinisoli]